MNLAVNNTNTFASAAAQSNASSQTGSIVLLSAVIALVRAAMVIIGAVSLGAAARYFFPEMVVIPGSPVALLSLVAIDTFAVVAGVLFARAKSAANAG